MKREKRADMPSRQLDRSLEAQSSHELERELSAHRRYLKKWESMCN